MMNSQKLKDFLEQILENELKKVDLNGLNSFSARFGSMARVKDYDELFQTKRIVP